MANSLTFNSVALSTYGLSIKSSNAHVLKQALAIIQTKDRGYLSSVQHPSRPFDFRVAVVGTGVADVISKLDNIKKTLGTETEHQLILDVINTRYFNAILDDFDGDFTAPACWEGSLSFICPDPLAYSTTETSSDFNIDADPDTITETVGGTAITKPVWTLTAGETLSDVTIKLENVTTGEELQWTGSLVDEDELEIDCKYWTVKKNSVSAMTITGEFPRLIAGSNSIKVTALSTTGTLNITYRDAYL